MDESRKRVILIAASILLARKLAQYVITSNEWAVLSIHRSKAVVYCPNRPMITPMMMPPSAPMPMIGA